MDPASGQQEYYLAYSLIFAFLILGMLVVCIPRPRKKGFVDPRQAEKDKKEKAIAKKKKALQKKKSKASKGKSSKKSKKK
ncbi:MAG: hypothetical protein AAF623_17680 [Planctomycetota bacterium]